MRVTNGGLAKRKIRRLLFGSYYRLGGIVGALFDLLEPELQRRFPGRGLVMVQGDYPYLRFPAIHPDVGDIEIYDDGDELTVGYGKFTHCHYGMYSARSEQWAKEAVDAVIADLAALFSDKLKMWGSHDGGGGIVREGYEEFYPADADYPLYVWSGPAKNPA
jgi:hypothetical protein